MGVANNVPPLTLEKNPNWDIYIDPGDLYVLRDGKRYSEYASRDVHI